MKLRYRLANQVVGVFVILAMALTVALLVLMGANQRWFRQNYEYFARLDSAKDVSVGMSISFRGFTIGRVTDISLTDENEVNVDFTIQEEYIDKVTADSIIQIVSNPLGGGEIIFHQGREVTPPLPEGTQIPIYDSKQGLRLREENRVIVLRDADQIGQILGTVERTLLSIEPTINEVNVIVASVAGLVDEMTGILSGQNTDGPITDILVSVDETVMALQRTVDRANTAVSEVVSLVNQTVGDVVTLANTTMGDLTTSATGFIDSTSTQVDSLLDNVGVIAGNVEQTTAALADPTGLIPRLLDPSGSIATLLDDDDELYNEILGIIGSVQASINDLNSSLQQVAEFTSYLNTTQPQITSLLEEGRQTLTTSQDVLEGLRNNPLLRGGIPEAQEQPSTFQSVRDEEF
jgi:phospholipid/cholesterol/gamma-HCH transport system substrate-binding protein